MTISSESAIGAGFVEELLALPTLEEQSAFARASDLLTPDGVAELLTLAAHLVRSDPSKGSQFAALCIHLAEQSAVPAAVPRATYLCAMAHAFNSEFDTALPLIDAARARYSAIGEHLEALYTNIGRMGVLIDLGHYQAALDAGQMVLDRLNTTVLHDPELAPQEAMMRAATVYLNQVSCYEQMGRYEEALQACDAAESRYRALQMTEQIGDISNNRGIVLINLGRIGEALQAYQTANTIYAEAGLTLLQARSLMNIGEAHLLLSNFTRSLDAFKQARPLYDALNAFAEQHVLLRYTADAYIALNLYPEALTTYREAASLLQSAGIPHDRAQALWGIGTALIAQAQFDQAGRALAEAAALFATADNLPLRSSVMLEQAALEIARQRPDLALDLAQQALALVAGHAWPVQHIYAHMRIADLLLPDTDAAERHLIEAQRLSDTLALPQLRYRLNQRLGHLRLLQGSVEEASGLLLAAVNAIEELRGGLAYEAMRTSFLRDKTAAYEDLVQLYLDQSSAANIRRAFVIAERAKSRALVDMLTGVIETQPAMLADQDLAGRLLALQSDLNAVYNELLGSTDTNASGRHLPSLHARAAELELEISRLRLQAADTTTLPDALVAPWQLDDIQAQLPADTALLAYHILGEEIVAFVSIQGQVSAVRRLSTLAKVQQLLQRLHVQWERFRADRAFVGQHMRVLEQSTQRVLAALYAELLAPLEQLLDGVPSTAGVARKLAIIPHGPLHGVPFHALFDGRQYAIDRFEIAYAPSAAVLALCQRRAVRQSGRALVMGVADALIPAVIAEAHAVAGQLRGAELRVDAQATVAAFLAAAPGSDIVHMACHGLFRADNPMFSALKLADGWLTAADVMPLDLAGALVMLSACESGRSQVIGGDEILGLTRAFLGAGATTVVVSLWLVQDETTAALMASWYERMSGGVSAATALRAAQQAIKARHPHPYYWAPFVLMGRG